MEEEYKFQIETDKIQSHKMYSKYVDRVVVIPSDIKEICNNTYEINITDLIFVPFKTKILVGYAKDKCEITCIRRHFTGVSTHMIDSAKMINGGIVILDKYVFVDGDKLQITLNRKLENYVITIFDCRYLISGLVKEFDNDLIATIDN